MDNKIIWTYSRAEAIEDGVLKDATLLALAIGFRASVALTSACWAKCVALRGTNKLDVDRLFEVLKGLRDALPFVLDNPQVNFDVMVRIGVEAGELVPLKAVFGSGDVGEPAITIMLPGED